MVPILNDLIHPIYSINNAGHLSIGGLDCIELAGEYGTPVYILDENEIRRNCRLYKSAMAEHFGDSATLYASKALSFRHIYRIAAEEGMCVDVVSPGELYTAVSAGFPAEKIFFHGNNKTDADLELALNYGVGCIVADNYEELDALDSICQKTGKKQKIYLRVTPGIDPHTHRKIITGSVDSKFGTPISTGQAIEIVKHALTKKNLDLEGLHCHVGSQIFDVSPFCDAADIMMRFIAEIKDETGYAIRALNLGGGFGVRYVSEDPAVDYRAMIKTIAAHIESLSGELGVPKPFVNLEPGRSIVAAAGITLYTVGTVREIPGFRNYVSVDGGMTDNPRYTLYGSQYTALIANRAAEDADYACTIAGRCCESGDLLAENISIQSCARGDILAVLVTGAYNYSMSSNYNRVPRPPVVMIRDGYSYVAVRRESYDDIIRLDR